MSNQNRSVSVGGNVTGSAIVTGDSNTVTVNYEKANVPPPETVDIAAELAALKAALAEIQVTDKDRRKLDNAIEDAEVEVRETEPDRDEVGSALERALKYAEKAEGFASQIEKLRPHVERAAGWLGINWHNLLPIVGLTG
ncbi:CHAT domain-containing protein [Desulfonema ishimotonii]|uniref:CHAT domain-containing protein n=1 Tax=Desulfonema ishimotonii TaxID=45657 RepID=A0A401FZL6_9BACT|nr:hypothetical protein [Desulfonema ishimotonii]GBC62400.1 CHAT domain-containing protein [Desulfonema ishimotonii]